MQIVFHLGAHCTDGGLLIRSILRNRAQLARQGIGVPGPGRYRELLGDTSTLLRGATADRGTQDMLLGAIVEEAGCERVVLSNENFLCRADVVLADNALYPKAEKSAWLRQCFPDHEVEFALGIRNPATFLPDLLGRLDEDPETRAVRLEPVSLGNLLWSDVVQRIANANPGAPITVWCHDLSLSERLIRK